MPCVASQIVAEVFLRAPELLPWSVGLFAAALAATLWFGLPQSRSVSAPLRWLVPGLRAMAIFALAASLVKPVVSRKATASEQGEVLVLIDRSRSMSVVDNQRAPAKLVALADALGYLPAGVRNVSAGQFINGCERL